MADSASAEQKTNEYEFNVKMTCGGCSGAVERVIKRLDGVKDYTVNLEKGQQVDETNVTVTAFEPLGYNAVLEKIKKTGKTVNWGKMNEETMAV